MSEFPYSQEVSWVWFRRDLRVLDNPALSAARHGGKPVAALFILDDHDERPIGGASRWWLNHSLTQLRSALDTLNIPLVVSRTSADRRAKDIILDLVEKTHASHVHWNRLYDKASRQRDSAVKAALKDKGVGATSSNGSLLTEPWTIETGSGGPYKVFTPFWRALCQRGIDEALSPLPVPQDNAPCVPLETTIDSLGLLPTKPDWSGGIAETWKVGSDAAMQKLDTFLDEKLAAYPNARDIPGEAGTSRLSPNLHWGEISPRQVYTRVKDHARDSGEHKGADKYLSELGWREFSHHLLYHFDSFATDNFQPKFDAFPWRHAPKDLKAWQKGMTGYPIVDAGMRELWHTGWMHNRVRMIVGSFLVKHLMIDWRCGEDWFWDTLVDANLANNAAGWQWIAGSGADAAPYFRIFNPFGQGEKFDTSGDYVRRWVPELAALDNKHIHQPWTATDRDLQAVNIKLGQDYPRPIVEHKAARERALQAFKAL